MDARIALPSPYFDERGHLRYPTIERRSPDWIDAIRCGEKRTYLRPFRVPSYVSSIDVHGSRIKATTDAEGTVFEFGCDTPIRDGGLVYFCSHGHEAYTRVVNLRAHRLHDVTAHTIANLGIPIDYGEESFDRAVEWRTARGEWVHDAHAALRSYWDDLGVGLNPNRGWDDWDNNPWVYVAQIQHIPDAVMEAAPHPQFG